MIGGAKVGVPRQVAMELTNRIKAGTAGMSGGLLIGQMLFALAFVASCEVSNFMGPHPEEKACIERWMTVSAMFIPSGLQKGGTSPVPPAMAEPSVRPRRTTTRRTSSKTAAKKSS